MQLSPCWTWMHDVADRIRSGEFTGVTVVTAQTTGLSQVHGILADGNLSEPLAKYHRPERAADVVDMINHDTCV